MNQQDEFTRLYNEYGEGIKKLCLGYTGDAVLAQDLLQETFIAVWNNMQQFRADAKWSTWIYRIAVNTCLTHLRKKTATMVDIENTSLAMLPDDINTKEQEVQLLYKCISQLPETERVIITLVLEDKPYEEIASITGITEANLRVKFTALKNNSLKFIIAMQDFDSLKNMWQQPAKRGDANEEILNSITNTTTTKMKLQKPQLHGAIALTLTAVFIACLALFGNLNFIHWYTYGGMVLICMICLVQAVFMYATYKKIKSIDDTVEPAAHLQQWEAYYDLRKKQNRWNMPVYYVLLNVAMAIYMIELFTGRPVLNVLIIVAVYAAWMLFAYFYLGRKNLRKEDNRLQRIIDELKGIVGQLNAEENKI